MIKSEGKEAKKAAFFCMKEDKTGSASDEQKKTVNPTASFF